MIGKVLSTVGAITGIGAVVMGMVIVAYLHGRAVMETEISLTYNERAAQAERVAAERVAEARRDWLTRENELLASKADSDAAYRNQLNQFMERVDGIDLSVPTITLPDFGDPVPVSCDYPPDTRRLLIDSATYSDSRLDPTVSAEPFAQSLLLRLSPSAGTD